MISLVVARQLAQAAEKKRKI